MKRLILAGLAATTAHAAELSKDHLEFFESKVRPILAESCYKCHSEAQGKTKGGLALDTKGGWEKGGESGAAIKPGDVDGSLLIKAVRYEDEDTQMPPKGEKLSAQAIAILEQWVKMGAPDPRLAVKKAKAGDGMSEEMQIQVQKHWAYQPVKEPAAPAVKDAAWPANDVDKFVLAKLEENGLTPSAPADKRTLIRRVFLDMIGLPPTPEQVMAFVKDESPEAFGKVVDFLLASPQYGERWGRHWLDVARYADTRGESRRGASPLSPYAWTYRDYVIQSLNADKPFDQFIKEQIAADQLPGVDKPALAALGFLTQGDQFMDNRNDIINDQIDVVTKGFLGLTVSCARCHDHFFDPVTQRDYYALHGIFNSCYEDESGPQVARAANPKATDEYQKERTRLLAEGKARLINQLNRMSATVNAKADIFLPMLTAGRQDGKFQELIAKAGLDRREAGDISRMIQRKMQNARNKGPRAAFTEDGQIVGTWLQLTRLPAEGFAPAAEKLITEMQNRPMLNAAVKAAFAGKKPQTLEEATAIFASVFKSANEAFQKEFAEWQKAQSVTKTEWFPGLKNKALEQVRTSIIDPYFLKDTELESNMRGLPQDLERQLNQLMAEVAKMDTVHPGSPGLANVLMDSPNPKNSPVFIRGQAQQPGPVVPRGFLEFVSAGRVEVPKDKSGRLQLAEAVASKDNPLTARVMVNRVWLHHFGEGFVSSPDDLGTMSEKPSNQPLLDYLASRFMADGWSLKKLHRTILLSKTYQQSSEPDAAKAKVDPFNRLLWRTNVRKLDFEALRDSILFIGGKLDTAMGGRPVNIESEPYSPRRSIYGFIDRTQMAEFMRHFDVANPALPTGRRHETIVPQQALFRMNSLLVIEQARNAVERKEFTEAQNDEARVKALYEMIYQRWPKPAEMKLALDFIALERTPLGQASASQGPAAPAGADELPAHLAKHFPREKTAKMSREEMMDYIRDLRVKGTINGEDLETIREYFKKRIIAATQSKADQARNANSNAVKEAVRDPNAEEVDKTPLNEWEKYAHALLMTNEVGYVN